MRNQTAALAAASVASFLVPFMMSAVAITLPVMQVELGASAVELSWVAGSYILALAAILLPIGRLADILGRRRTFVWGTGAFVVFSLCASLAWSVVSLVVLRVVQGVGAAMILATGVAIVTELYPREERGRVMGILVACVYLGLSVGPLVGGMMTSLFGWRSVFFLCLPPGLLAWIMARGIKDEWRPARGQGFDLIGSLLYAAFVVCCVNGLTGLARPERGLPLLGGALVMGVLFVLRSRGTQYPLIDLTLFTANRVFLLSSLATLINYAGTFAVGFLLSLYLQVVKGFSPMHAGFILIVQPVVQSLLSPVAGILSDRFNAAWLASLGMAFCALGLWAMCGVGAQTGLWEIGAILALLGLGFALFASPNMSVVMGSVEPKDYSIASSLVATMRTFGMTLSMGISAVVFGFLLQDRQISAGTIPEFLASMKIIFAVCAGLCVAGVFCSLGRVAKR
ncbi:MAG: MFS transporter [Desulfomicrobium apsheronum]|nr:MFS transporter [Desulfomicrobium apsheronum]